jgi:long-chain acyl-CoA synthetase
MGTLLCEVDIDLDFDIVDLQTCRQTLGEVGELFVKGPKIFEGHWEKPRQTDAAFDGEWFRTGDIVTRDDDSYLVFVDRLKNLLVLDTGKNVAPEPIEDAFATSPRVDQIIVLGDNEKFISALVVPNFDELRGWADEEGIDLPDRPEEIVDLDAVHEWVDEEGDRVNDTLSKHEQIKEFRVIAEEWTPDNDLLTPSMKKKRRNIRSAFEAEIESIYGRGGDESEPEAEATTD